MGTISSIPSHLPLGKGRKELRALFSSSGRLGVAMVGAGLGEQGERASPLVLSSLACLGDQWSKLLQKTPGLLADE